MKLIKYLTIVSLLSTSFSFSLAAGEGEVIESVSFQRVKRELWAFGPEFSAPQTGQRSIQQQKEQLGTTETSEVPEELARALLKYSVEL